jgi:N-acetylglucosamine malate deacetylase 2
MQPPTAASAIVVGGGVPGDASAVPAQRSGNTLPGWREVLAVVAHPDDESFGLGALLSSFVAAGSRISLLCLTHGEASTLHGVDGDLRSIRAMELSDAAAALGVARVRLAAYPDGALSGVDLDVLIAEVADFAGPDPIDGIIAFDRDGVTGHPDHRRATEASIAFASRVGVPVLGWALPEDVAAQLNTELGAGFTGYSPSSIDLVVPVDRETQHAAIAQHRSQALPGQALWRRLELSGAQECLRWQEGAPAPATRPDLADREPVAATRAPGTTRATTAATRPAG